jgi:hypothetical protein
MDTDHIDHDKLNNQCSNLRSVTHTENVRYRQKLKQTSSRFKGVYWSKSARKWRSSITYERKVIQLGYFDAEEDAARAYDTVAVRLHGKFAITNNSDGLIAGTPCGFVSVGDRPGRPHCYVCVPHDGGREVQGPG